MDFIQQNNVADPPPSRPSRRSAVVGRSFLYASVCHFILTPIFANADNITHQTYTDIIINNAVVPLKLSEICPGVEYLYNKPNVSTLRVNGSRCSVRSLPKHTTHQGVVYGFCGRSDIYCRLHIEVPQGMFVRAYIQKLDYWCQTNPWKIKVFADYDSSGTLFAMYCGFHMLKTQVIDSFTNHMFLTLINLPPLRIKAEAVNKYGFIVGYASAHSGYVILPGYTKDPLYSTNASVELKAPVDNVIVISFHIKYKCIVEKPCLEMSYIEPKVHHQKILQVCSTYDQPVLIFPSSCLYIGFRIVQYSFLENGIYQKMFFSFHSKVNQPQKFISGFFNCSVNHYSGFKHHLNCNLKTECEDGQDETEHCPFSSSGCQGLVASRNKCFQHVTVNNMVGYKKVEQKCLEMGGRIASLKTRQEQNDFLHIIQGLRKFKTITGHMSGWYLVPFMYSKFRKWSDRTVIYNIDLFLIIIDYKPSRTPYGMSVSTVGSCFNVHPYFMKSKELVCEIQSNVENVNLVQTVEFPDLYSFQFIFKQTQNVLFQCQDLHVTHSFQLCDPNSYCGKMKHSQFCVFLVMNNNSNTLHVFGNSNTYTIAMFKCDDDITTVPYSLVCDFRQDCTDNSDESFCMHASCNGVLCSSGQCVWCSQHCDTHPDCLDDSDEVGCIENYTDSFYHKEANRKQQLFINLDGTGYFIQQAMKNESCPDSHYWCTEDWLYCLPVYTRCNGFSDCTYGEEEKDCETVTCPGFYRCRASDVCVHGNHLCDGWGQCPQRDDEWLCDMTCPNGCFCQGYSFLCHQSFSADLFPQLRYVDATGSEMSMADFSTNAYLIRLSVSYCSLVVLPNIKLSNLQYIDLANNQLKNINMNVFAELINLRILILANNPLLFLTGKLFNVYYSLRRIDLSRTCIKLFNDETIMYLPQAKYLNLSSSAISSIGNVGFKNIPAVTELDIRKNPVRHFKVDLFSKVTHLRTVFSPNFRLCCAQLLPKLSVKVTCLAPHPTFSSCTQLLPTDLYRLLFLLFGICATLGNVICFLALFVKKKIFRDDFITLYGNFQMASLGMGINISMATVVNEIFHGNYMYFEQSWINSLTCKVATFLSFLSNEVSVLIILFMILDHVFILCFPLTRRRLNPHSTTACAVTWFTGMLLSVIPFLPGLSHWGLDGQSGLCRLALFDCYYCNHNFRWFKVTAVFNFVLCSVFVVGEIIIIQKTSKFQVVIDPKLRAVYSSIHLLLRIALIEFVCWFSFGISSMVSLRGIAVSEEIHVALVVFILPLNSALSPLLYVWTVISQQQQQAQEDKVLTVLKSRLSSSLKRDK